MIFFFVKKFLFVLFSKQWHFFKGILFFFIISTKNQKTIKLFKKFMKSVLLLYRRAYYSLNQLTENMGRQNLPFKQKKFKKNTMNLKKKH